MRILTCKECGYSRSSDDDGRMFFDDGNRLLCSECGPFDCARCGAQCITDGGQIRAVGVAIGAEFCGSRRSNGPHQKEETMTIPESDMLEARIRELIREQMQGGAPMANPFGTFDLDDVDFEDVLAGLDPADSDASLAMYRWLTKNGRLIRAGNLALGDLVGDVFLYVEPQGSSKEGYVAGGTQGDRLVNEAIQKAEQTGTKARLRGLCKHCISVVQAGEGEIPFSGDNPAYTNCEKSPNGIHEMSD